MKAFIPRSSSETSRGSWSDGRGKLEGRSSGGGKSRSWGRSGGHSGSDSDSWRKEKPGAGQQVTELENRDAEVTSPMKKKGDPMQVEAQVKFGQEVVKGTTATKQLTYESREPEGEHQYQDESSVIVGGVQAQVLHSKDLEKGKGSAVLVGQDVVEESVCEGGDLNGGKGNGGNKKEGSRFRRKERRKDMADSAPLGVTLSTKRGGEEVEGDVDVTNDAKKQKTGESSPNTPKVGLSEQPCRPR